jgi:hypothetical protein
MEQNVVVLSTTRRRLRQGYSCPAAGSGRQSEIVANLQSPHGDAELILCTFVRCVRVIRLIS